MLGLISKDGARGGAVVSECPLNSVHGSLSEAIISSDSLEDRGSLETLTDVDTVDVHVLRGILNNGLVGAVDVVVRPLGGVEAIEEVHGIPESVISVGGVVLKEPLDGDDQVVDTGHAPGAINTVCAVGVAFTVIVQHSVGQSKEFLQGADDLVSVAGISLSELDESKEHGGSGPEVSLVTCLRTNPAIISLETKYCVGNLLDLALEGIVTEKICQGDHSVEPVGQSLVKAGIVNTISGAWGLKPSALVDINVELVLMASQTATEQLHLVFDPSFGGYCTKGERLESPCLDWRRK